VTQIIAMKEETSSLIVEEIIEMIAETKMIVEEIIGMIAETKMMVEEIIMKVEEDKRVETIHLE